MERGCYTPEMTSKSEAVPLASGGIDYAARLPLGRASLPSPPDEAEIECWMSEACALLRVLAGLEAPPVEREGEPACGKTLERLEAKLDLALGLMMRFARAQDALPPAVPSVLGPTGLTWEDEREQPLRAGEPVLLSLHLSPRLPLPLTLPAEVTAVERLPGGVRISARFTGLSEETRDWLERTLFRFHRRAIQQARRQPDAQ